MEHSYTKTERKIALYILNNFSKILPYSSFELAEKIGVSQSAVIKFISKIGIDGFTEFKVLLGAENMIDGTHNNILKHGNISLENSIEEVSQAIVGESVMALTKTLEQINFDSIKQVIKLIDSCDRIFIFGKGSSSLPAFDLSSKLMKIGLTAIWYQDLDSIKAASLNCSNKDVFIAFTFSGQTEEIISILESAREKNANIITVTKNVNSIAGQLSTTNLEIISNETLFRTSAMSSLIAFFSVVDILFLGLIKENLETRLEMVQKVYQTTARRK